MASGATTVYGFPYPVPTDANNVPGDVQAFASKVETVMGVQVTVGVLASRPAPAGVWAGYISTDEALPRWYATTGATWYALTPLPAAPQTIPASIPFHISGILTVGLKIPKFVATRNMTLRLSSAQLDVGSGATYQIYINRAASGSIPASAAVGTTTVVYDFTDININAGDTVQVYISGAGSSASDLSVTIDAVYR
jgi:hypothetical protein